MTQQTPTPPYLLLAGRIEVLQNVAAFCRQVYYLAFGPVEGERRFQALTLIDAVALWKEGLPDSLTVH